MKFRKAQTEDIESIWHIIKFAIKSKKEEGSNQWQDGYPNKNTIIDDINSGHGYVIESQNQIVMYGVVQFNAEPTYQNIDGAWSNNSPYVVIHRLAVAEGRKGKGLAKKFIAQTEKLALSHDIFNIRIDTNHDNNAMLHILKSKEYKYCGQVFVRGKPREAFQKVLESNQPT